MTTEDRVAVEVFPAAAKLIDQANMYHLWVLPDNELPFGLDKQLWSNNLTA